MKVCDRVIRLGGSPTLIQVIQSKGRARDKAGRLDLICTAEEEEHFDDLLDEEDLLDLVLRNRASGHSGNETPDYIAEFMQSCGVRGKPRHDIGDDDGDDESVASDDSASSAQPTEKSADLGEEEKPDAEELDNVDSKQRNYGVQLLLCSDHTDTEEMLTNALRLQAALVDYITKLHFSPRAASSVVSDPRMFRSSDSLALVGVSSAIDNFLSTFCSVWDFKVNSAPVYILAHPSRPSKPEKEKEPATPLLIESPSDINQEAFSERVETGPISSLGGVLGVSCGHLVSRQSFLQMGKLGRADLLEYKNIHVERGKRNTLLLEGCVPSNSDARVLVSIPATILSKSAVVSAERTEKTLTVFFALLSTPSVHFLPSVAGKKNSNSNIIGAKINLFDSLRSDCRVFCNATPPSDSSSVHNIASADLLQLASCPVIAVTFKLRKWRKVMKLFTNPSVLGLSVLVTRVAFGSYTGDLSHQSLLLEDTHVADELAVHQQLSKECQWTYATLVSDVYCPVLNPVVLVKIRAIVAAALLSKDEVRIRSVTTAMQQLQSHLKQCCYWEDALAYFTTALNTLETAAMRRESLSTVSGGDGDPSLSAVVGGSEQFPIESSEEYVMMPRVLATPSRLVVTPAVLTKTNRLIRLYGSKYRLVYVKFRDEQGQGLFSEKIFEGRYKQMLIQGFNICGRQYHFLLSSASQLREQTAVFFDGSLEDVFMIRNFIIPNKSVFNDDVAKYISRLGLFCTADSDTHVMLSKKNYLMEDDIYTKDGKILTDGAGRISTRLLREIFKDSGHHPSCIQIRALGCKGILVEDPDLETTHPGIDVVFRRSMCKFDTESHTSLCVVKTAEFNPVTLNREVINLLCAIRDKGEVKKWSPHSTMVALQDEELNRLGQMLVDPMCAIDSLSEHFPRKILWNMLQSELNILSEPHFMSLLHLQYYHASKALRRKSHIPILHGALIMGAPDPTGLLRDGEISIVIHRPVHRYADCFNDKDEYKVGEVTLKRVSPKSPEDANWAVGYETFVVTGPVAFYRNPCLDPGDLRVVTAVYRPELVHWKNVVLLPASAEYCKRSLSAECSGGDVDGDQFGIIWDSRLVPPRELGFDAVDYEQLAREAKQQQLRDTKAEPVSSDSSTAEKGSVDIELIRIADFVARTMCNCNLGRIANLHLALCDQVRKGAGNPLARELAKAQSLAVDYPKTGIPPVIPSEAKQVVRYTGYPHYMENDRKPSYPSFQSLGTLYNITSSVACTVAFAGADREFHADASFALPGWEECRAEAQESYELFERAARDLMLRYGLESDAELVLGVPYKWSDEFELDHASAAESLSAAWAALRGRFRRLFYSDLPDNSPAARLRKACAWYQVSYSQKSRLHSFAWIMVEELAQVKVTSAEAVTTLETHQLSGGGSWPVHDAVSITVGQGALRRWEQQRAQLVQALSIKDQQFARVKSAFLNSQAVQKYQTEFPGQKITVHLYGSAALLMCDYLSDIDICVNVPKLPAEMVLKDLVKPGVSAVAEWTSSVIPAKIPLVKLLVEDGHMSAPVEVTAQNSDGVHKSGLIRYLYSTNPTYLLLFSSIVQWARCCGLLRGFATEKRNALLNSGQVQALIVHFILERIPSLALPESALEKAHTDVTNTSILSAVSSADAYTLELGQLLLAFFMNYSQWGGAEDNEDTTEKGAAGTGSKGRAFNFTWPVPGFPEHDVEPTKMQEISQCCRRALHCLAVSRNWSYLLEYCIAFEKARTSLELELSVSLSKIIGPAKAFHEMWLRCKSKASYVHIAYSKADPSRLVVHATGRYQQIQVLRQELLTLIYTGRLHSYGSIRSMASAYFMEGSSFLYAIGTDSKAAMLQARPMYVDRYLLRHAHTMKELSTLSMSGAYKKTNDVWKVAFKADFHAKVAEQLSHLSKVKKDEQVIFSVHLGKMLLLDASRTFERSRGALSASDMESAMNSSRNMKISTYGMEAKQDGAAGVAKSPASKPDTKNKANGKGNAADGGSGRTNAGAIATVKNNLASTFASAIPIFEGADCSTVTGSSSEKSRTPHSLYMENIARVTGKLQSVLGDLGYEEFLLADPQGAIQIPGTTLLLPPAGWRVAVELSERQQLHVDLDAQGRIAAVSDRFLSWVNGTLVTPAEVDLGSPPAAESDTEPAGPAATAATKTIKYQFKDHDLRFKIGTVKTIPASNDLHHLACPGGNPPIEIHNADEDEGESGVDSNLSSEYLRAAQAGGGTALPLIHPSPLMKRPDMVSFARHVVQRRAFLLPSSTATAAVEGACRVMAVVAVGDCYEGAALRDVNPFVDISLEVDASGLLSCLGSQVLLDADSDSTKNSAVAGEEESGDQPDASLAVSDPLALGEHLDSICDEILRVSEKIRETW